MFKPAIKDLYAYIYVTEDCEEKCNYCSERFLYQGVEPTVVQKCILANKVSDLADTPINTFIITGGEPAYDISELLVYLDLLHDKKVYIMTSMPYETCDDLIEIANGYDNINGILIARNAISEDKERFYNPAPDMSIGEITKPVVIRTVPYMNFDLDLIKKRWEDFKVSIEVVENHRFTNSKSLHKLTGLPKGFEHLTFMTEIKTYLEHHFIFCEPTATKETLINKQDKLFAFTKEMPFSHLRMEDDIYVERIILYPSGFMTYQLGSTEPITIDDINKMYELRDKELKEEENENKE